MMKVTQSMMLIWSSGLLSFSACPFHHWVCTMSSSRVSALVAAMAFHTPGENGSRYTFFTDDFGGWRNSTAVLSGQRDSQVRNTYPC
jgi:hypothetical protein